mmetsp:Transcript_25392/g.46510  ORF Transcript_25392/g.46510 Transcript_25392/m.46510 type:complete len:278 (-) Transcript_25392:101-934(-)
MPADRRHFRKALLESRAKEGHEAAALRARVEELDLQLKSLSARLSAAGLPAVEKGKPQRLIGFDFDCTITVRHFFKVFAWGYMRCNSHQHFEEFSAWCKERKIDPFIAAKIPIDDGDAMTRALDDFIGKNGEATFRSVFREMFLGGEERIKYLAEWLGKLQEKGVTFAIVTAGFSTAVLRGLHCAPELQCFFPSSRVWDTSQGRHRIRSVIGQKALMLRDISPEAQNILLVDDSLVRDVPPAWAPTGAGVTLFEGLPYEGPGLTSKLLDEVERQILQ